MMMTAPSTISEVERTETHQVPDTPPRTIPVMVNSIARDDGCGDERGAEVPQQQEQDHDHQQAPSIRFFEMVCMVRSTSTVRS